MNSPSSVLKTRFGDGTWVVGDEIAAGRYSPVDDWTHMPECVWYISPITQQVGGSPSPIPATKLIVALHEKESITVYHCGDWVRVGD